MLQATVCDGVALDAVAFCEDRLGPAEVDIGWREVVEALMIAEVIVVFDEGPYLSFEIASKPGVPTTATCRSSFLAFLSQPEHLAAQVKIVA
jgi:hypothetical protein